MLENFKQKYLAFKGMWFWNNIFLYKFMNGQQLYLISTVFYDEKYHFSTNGNNPSLPLSPTFYYIFNKPMIQLHHNILNRKALEIESRLLNCDLPRNMYVYVYVYVCVCKYISHLQWPLNNMEVGMLKTLPSIKNPHLTFNSPKFWLLTAYCWPETILIT